MYHNTTRKATTIGSIVFLLLAFPLGLIYFLLIVIGFAVGLSTVIVWIGLPILFGTLFLVHGMATVERGMVANLLNIPFRSQELRSQPSQQGLWKRFGRILRDPLTWTSTMYMLIKLPLGIISFVLALVLPIVSICLTLLPLAYLLNLFIDAILLKNGIRSTSYIIPYFVEIHGGFDPIMFVRSFVGVPVGLLTWFITGYVLKGLARISGEMAYALLSRGEVDTNIGLEQRYATNSIENEQHYYAPQRSAF